MTLVEHSQGNKRRHSIFEEEGIIFEEEGI